MNFFPDDAIRVGASGTKYDENSLPNDWIATVKAFPAGTSRVSCRRRKGIPVLIEYAWSGTPKGECYEMPASDKKVKIPGVVFIDFEGDQIKLVKDYCDRLRLEQRTSENGRKAQLITRLIDC